MRSLWLVMLLVAALVVPVSAQETTGTITGVTADQTGAVSCTVSLTTCNPSNDTFGQILSARAPREVQLGLKFYW